ncbi:hypothetical protein NDU88_002437 [Pleurodeles waltl]|uniref:Uncharacterized protein n=1 Tax=Pleurodeles waltl TaxID=8319 RepID=A0AAV7TKI9_PLEWA|nr:hypothetical protein NDU88_002437 [Pleurodeles waltl]
MPVQYRSAVTSVLQVRRSVGPESPRTITTCRNALTALAQGAPDQGGQGASALKQDGSHWRRSRPGRRSEGAAPRLPTLTALFSAPGQAHQLGHGRAGVRHPRSTSLDGGDHSDSSEEARASPHHGQQGPGEDSGNSTRRCSGAAQLPVRAAGSDGCRL